MNILGIETSCDETAAAVVCDGTEVRANVVSSQVALHRPYGGVVPELASRNHLALIETVIAQSLAQAGISITDLDAVAATSGPGLASSLLIGLNAGKGLALALGVPFLAINHLEAHLYSPFIPSPGEPVDAVFPAVGLIVSGGHTILAYATALGRHEILGQTVDDAAGEAFDKVAKLLGLGYPGGPEIDRCAQDGNPAAVSFPRSMIDDPRHDFSFSGLKTAVLYFLRKSPTVSVADICASFQEAVVDVLVAKTVRAATERRVRTIAAAGGVSLNSRLRTRLATACQERGWQLRLAAPAYCTDNAAMIAALAYHQLRRAPRHDWAVEVSPAEGLRCMLD